jgi:protein-tyrosine-phosphatase
MPSILIVCTANICRSPLAMAILEARLAEDAETSDWKVESAGTWALEGERAARFSQAAASQRGLDLSNHLSRNVNREMMKSFDLILTMERGQKEALTAEFPESADQIFMVSELVGGMYDIYDPIGGPYSDYENTAAELERIFKEGLEHLKELVVAA